MGDEAVVDAWIERTSAFDRVRSVSEEQTEPQPVSYIAEEAHVAENTARDHLDRLVDMGFLLKEDRGGLTEYSPDPLHARMQELRSLLDDYDRDELIERKAEMQERIEDWEAEYGVDSPEALRESAAQTEESSETRDVLKTASDWELAQYRLGVIEDAIENYELYSHDFRATA